MKYLFSAIGTVLLVLLPHFLRVSRENHLACRTAGKRIADAFRPEYDSLVQTNNDARSIMTEEAFKKHESAIRSNISSLLWLSRLRLRYAWKALAYHPQEERLVYYVQYSDCGSLDKRRQVRPVLIKRLQRIISIVE